MSKFNLQILLKIIMGIIRVVVDVLSGNDSEYTDLNTEGHA